MKDAELKFNEIVEQFKESTKNAMQDALDSIHSEMVPYLNEDTEHNARYRANDIVNSIIHSDGQCTLNENSIEFNGWSISLSSADHDRLVEKLALVAGDKAKDLKIERLERQLKEAQEMCFNSSYMAE
ncbi:coil containing protein [Vibrio phage 1.199.A._10N.286.55.C10]|nr:coil containing protein [Vibrio phage 1.199.A._10N.286.55.C10]AUR94948.1 coil containing protein [Vibrio phage 1.199.B._10N.286.55.C10]AUR97629.1 coil containing protein [Vibrio phage 1.243.O._10N.261.54.B5]CAH9015019.1 coil containing protein [Vibrio phage 511E55-1]